MLATTVLPYPTWLNPGDNAWQMTAATLVGLMSVPGLVVLYGGVMQKRWSVNSMMLAFSAFAVVLIVWVLFAFNMGFGHPWHGIADGSGGFFDRFFGNFIGQPGAVLNHVSEQGQATIPLVGGPDWHFPQSTLVYFQFVFAAITPLLMLGSVLGRDQLQGVARLRPALDLGRLRRQRVHDLGRRLLRPAGRDRLLGRLRDPSRRGRRRVRRSSGDRPTTGSRPRDRRPEQPANGGDGCRPAVARLERLQRRRSVLRQRRCLGRDPEHEPLHRCGVPRVGALGLHDRPQAVADRQRQRHDRRPRRDHPGGRFRQRLRRDADRRHRLHRSSSSPTTT